jgi:hypothetical protein
MVGTGDRKHYRAGMNVKVLTSRREVFFCVSKYLDGKSGCRPQTLPFKSLPLSAANLDLKGS